MQFSKSIQAEELAAITATSNILGVRSGPVIPREVIESGDQLHAIGCFCVGTSHIDRASVDENGIALFNSVHENTRSVAEYVIGSVFGLLRRIPEHSRSLHDGVWSKTDEISHEVRGKTLGIVGYGAIGGQVSVLAENVGMDVIYFDPNPQIPPHGRAKRLDTFEEVLAEADIVTLHIPGGKRNRHLINADSLATMKKGSYLINASRGEVVDYDAVGVALEDGQLSGIAADVFEDEPSKLGDGFEHVLKGVGRAILTPHIGGSTVEAQADIGEKTAQKLAKYLLTGDSSGSVNLPEIALEALVPETSRLLNIHTNERGALATISGVLADADLNIVSTLQKEKGDLAYVALDVEGIIEPETIDEIKLLKCSRRVRVIES